MNPPVAHIKFTIWLQNIAVCSRIAQHVSIAQYLSGCIDYIPANEYKGSLTTELARFLNRPLDASTLLTIVEDFDPWHQDSDAPAIFLGMVLADSIKRVPLTDITPVSLPSSP